MGQIIYHSGTTPLNVTGSPNNDSTQYVGVPYALTDATNITVDWNNGNNQTLTMGGDREFDFVNGIAGGRYQLIITQDSTGYRNATWYSNIKWSNGSAPSLSGPNGTGILEFIYDGNYYYGFIDSNYI